MRHVLAALLLTDLVVLPGLPAALTQPAPTPKGQRLEALTWVEAERLLTRDAVVVIPLGAGSVEHGPHLPLQTDAILADYLARRVLDAAAVMVAPLLPYHYYPAFADYPGSTSLSLQTARDLTTDVVRSLARSGPRRFYVLNTAIPATPALDLAASALAAEGILLRHTNVEGRLQSAAGATRRQEGGNHADEIETSMMLFIDPGRVSMSAATKDLAPASTPFRLARAPDPAATLSTTGIWGDPTLATAEKGGAIVESFVRGIVDDIQALQAAPLPAPSARTGPAATPVPSRPASERTGPTGRCLPGDERAIINIGNAFATHWANADAEKLGALWSRFGDMIHPDGMIERTSMDITMNPRSSEWRIANGRREVTLGNGGHGTAQIGVK